MVNITLDELLAKGLGQQLELEKQGTWGTKSPDQQQLIALQAKFDSIEDDKFKLKGKLKLTN